MSLIHIDVHNSVDFESVLNKLDQVLKNQKLMSKQNDDLNAKVYRLTGAFEGVKADVKFVKDALAATTNGLTQAETEALDAKLGPVVDALEALDAETDSTVQP